MTSPIPENVITMERNLHKHTPICGRCGVNLTCKRNDVWVRLTADSIIAGDLLECPTCGARIVTGFAKEPVQRHGRCAEAFPVWEEQMGENLIANPYHKEVYL